MSRMRVFEREVLVEMLYQKNLSEGEVVFVVVLLVMLERAWRRSTYPGGLSLSL